MSADKERSAGIAKTFSLVAILTVASKLLGLVRDIVVAHAYGTGIIADAYNFAYLFTGNVLILFGGLGGPFHSSTVAVLNKRKDDPDSGKLLGQITLYTFAALIGVTVIALILAPFVSKLTLADYKIVREHLSPELAGWTDLQLRVLLQDQVVKQFMVMSPLIVLSGLIGIVYGALNVHNRIFWPSLSPAIASLAIIIAVWFYADPASAAVSGLPLAIGTLIGAVGQLLAQIPDLSKLKLKWQWSFKSQEGSSEYSAMLWPAVFSTSVGQLTVYVDAFFTSAIGQGSWTAVLMSNRLVQLPLGVLLTAMLVPILPRFTQQADAGKMDELKEELRRSLRFLWFLSLPLTVFFLAIPEPIIKLLFQHGSFNKESTELVTIALLFLAPSIFFYVARDLITRVFYALKDSTTPFRVALCAIIIKAALDWYFVYYLKLDLRGISLASTIITIINLSLLSIFLRQKIGLLGFSRLLRPLAVMILAAILCGVSSYFVNASLSNINWLESVEPVKSLTAGNLGRFKLIFELAAATGTGGVIYLLCCRIFGLEEVVLLAERLPFFGKSVKK